jgi:hypothetical protein
MIRCGKPLVAGAEMTLVAAAMRKQLAATDRNG